MTDDVNKEASIARAARIRETIADLKNTPAATPAAADGADAETPSTPRDAIHRRMRELDE